MDGFRLSLSLPLALIALSVGLVGCGSPVKSSKSGAPGFTVGGGSDPSNPTADDEPSETAGFFLKLTSTTANVTLHRTLVSEPYADSVTNVRSDVGTTNWTDECRIASTAADGTRDVLCIAEIEELDMYFSEFTLQYHVPPSMCSYVSFIPYHFYAYEPGEGPANVSWAVSNTGVISAEVNSDNGVPVCEYDYRESDGPNCCLGTFTTSVTTEQADGSFVNVVTPDLEWNGEVSACLSGPAMSAAWADYRSTNGLPLSRLEYVEGVGFNNTFTIDAAIKTDIAERRFTSNVWAANFYNPTDHTTSPGLVPTTIPATDSRRPAPLKIPQSVAPINRFFPQDSYMVTCYDRAQDIQSRIRLMIREWNEEANYVDGGDPDVSGSNDPDFPDSNINDRNDWLDFGDVYPASSS